MSVKPIPDGYHSITPYLIVSGAAKALEFYYAVFGAKELLRIPGPDGTIGHAEFKIGDSIIMIADEPADTPYRRNPKSFGGSPVGFMVYLPDVDAAFALALKNGASVHKPLQDQFYGDRSGTIIDPFGHVWTIATHTEDVSPDEMERRIKTWQDNA